jgi:restriction system protein
MTTEKIAKRMWMVRSDAGKYFNEFQEKSCVAIGWQDLGDVAPTEPKAALVARLAATLSHLKPGSWQSGASQILRFLNEIKIGDGVVTYDPSRRIYAVGEFTSDASFDAKRFEGELPRVRKVRWMSEVSRDQLSIGTRNTLGSTLTLFEVSATAAEELRTPLNYVSPQPIERIVVSDEPEETFRDQENKAIELIKDQVNTLDWQEMQELVAGILRAMGYKTQVSPLGPDRGKDIVASPDGFGFENPRIVVEVKHRNGAMGAKEVRSFLGGRHKDDRGLYVSTGGFSKDARYEAERASVATVLWDLSDLVLALIEHYEKIAHETIRLVPLRRVYWPA